MNANVDNYTPLLAASCTSNHKSREDKKKSLQILIKGGADVNMSGYERSPLMACAEVGSTEGLQVLIDAGAEVNQGTNSGRTALIGTVTSVHIDCMETLIKAGADVNRQNNHGDTVLLSLTAVINFNRTDFERLCGIKLLLKSGANLFLVDCIEINIGCILLCRALHFAHREILLYTSRECHYVGELVTSPSQCAEKKNAPNTLLYKLTVYYIRDFINIERMPQRINNCKRNRFLYFF